MSNLIIPGNPTCPLCLRRMKAFKTRVGIIFACFTDTCMVSINAKDPCCAKWDTRTPVPCTACGTEMRHFFRADGYLKYQCPECLKHGRLVQVVRGHAEDLPKEK